MPVICPTCQTPRVVTRSVAKTAFLAIYNSIDSEKPLPFSAGAPVRGLARDHNDRPDTCRVPDVRRISAELRNSPARGELWTTRAGPDHSLGPLGMAKIEARDDSWQKNSLRLLQHTGGDFHLNVALGLKARDAYYAASVRRISYWDLSAALKTSSPDVVSPGD